MKVEIGIKNGVSFLKVDNDVAWKASRALTKTTNEGCDEGIFLFNTEKDVEMFFEYGREKRIFLFKKIESGKEREEIIRRLNAIRDWVADIDYCITFEIF